MLKKISLAFQAFLLILFLLLSSCPYSKDTSSDNLKASLDAALKCQGQQLNYVFDKNNLHYPDAACTYGKSNKLGDVQVYLFPKSYSSLPKTDNALDAFEQKVNAMNITELKNNFNIFVRVVDKAYLDFANSIDTPYLIKDNYKSKVYTFDNGWRSVDVNADIDEEPFDFYVSYFLSHANPKVTQTKLPVSILSHVEHDFNDDGLKDKTVVYKLAGNKLSNYDATIVVFRNIGHSKYRIWAKNNVLLKDYGNCGLDGFDNLVAKGRYFTVEHFQCPDARKALVYSTFKYNKRTDTFLLHKNTMSFYQPQNSKDKHCKYNKNIIFSEFDGKCS